MTGEFGRRGRVIAQGETGQLIAAFGGESIENDVHVSGAGREIPAQEIVCM
jgi:hypothetical protein